MLQQTDRRTNLLALTESGMATFVASLGWPAYRASQILRWLYQERARTFAEMSNLSQKDRDYLTGCCRIERTSAVQVFSSQDGTKKFVLTLADGKLILLDSPNPQSLRFATARLQQALHDRLDLNWQVVASTATPHDQVDRDCRDEKNPIRARQHRRAAHADSIAVRLSRGFSL